MRAVFLCRLVCCGALVACSSPSSEGSGTGLPESSGGVPSAAGNSATGGAGTSGTTSGANAGATASTSAGAAGVGGAAAAGSGGIAAAGTAGSGIIDDPKPSGLGPPGGSCVPGATYGSPLPQVRQAKLIRGNFGELEGPVWVAAQHALYFCEAGDSVGQIHKYTPADGKIVTFVDNIGVGGLAMDAQGKLVAATYDKLRLSHIDPVTGARADVEGAASYLGKPFNEVNDVVVRGDGNMYFSDPGYGPAAGNQDAMAFYRLSPAGVVTRIAAAKNANGVALSPDGAWLYLSTTDGGPALQRFALAADGSPTGAGTTWKDAESDGMAVDCAGNLYLSAAGVIKVVSPSDEALGTIDGLGTSYVTNAAFGGEDRKTLFITTGEALYQLTLAIPGFPN